MADDKLRVLEREWKNNPSDENTRQYYQAWKAAGKPGDRNKDVKPYFTRACDFPFCEVTDTGRDYADPYGPARPFLFCLKHNNVIHLQGRN